MTVKRLILNCDDFGQSPAMNAAIMHLLEEGKVSSATLMAPAPGFAEAAAWCRRRARPNIGLHLTFNSEFEAWRWTSLTGHPSLHDDTGCLYRTVEEFERKADAAAVVREMEAQLAAVRKYGIDVTHADNHMGSLYGIATGRSFVPQAVRFCARHRLPFRLFRRVFPEDPLLSAIPGVERAVARASALAGVLGVAIPDYLLSHPYAVQEGETYDTFKRSLIGKLYRLPEGVCETYIHPAVDDAEMRRKIPNWEKRVWEFRLMLDDDFAYALRDAGVELVDYRHVRAFGRAGRFRSLWELAKAVWKSPP